MILVHRLVENESLLTSLRSCRVHHPSDKFICETLVCLSQSFFFFFFFFFRAGQRFPPHRRTSGGV